MTSIADELRNDLEARGEYVVRANASTGWFAVFLTTWHDRTQRANSEGREGPNLVVYRTKSDDIRDHYAIPHSVIRDLLVEDTMTISEVNGSQRWNLTLKNGKIHVSHARGSVDVSKYHGARLIVEEGNAPDEYAESKRQLLPEEVVENSVYNEGSVQRILVNRYERDCRARETCIEHFGTTCVVCGFEFGATYGDVMKGLIHVHHLKPLSDVGPDYEVDPIADLRPLCPNCHAVVHHRKQPYSLDEVRGLLHGH